MKKINFARISWITALFLGLIVILIAVMDYKINHEFNTKNIIYFYECDGNLCVTEAEDDKNLLYSKYECGYESCPVFKLEINDTYVILDDKNSSILFDYRNGKTISTDYKNYQLINNNYIIVTKENKQGIININNQLTVPVVYEQLGYSNDGYLTGYNLKYIIAKRNDKYGIISLKDNTVIEEFTYDESEINSLLKVLEEKEKDF